MNLQGLLGLAFLAGLAWLISENRRRVPVVTVLIGLAVQVALAFLMLKVPFFKDFFLLFNKAVLVLEKATTAGTSFVFGYLGGGKPPFVETYPGSSFIFAFRAMPLLLVISALSSVLFYWGILPRMVRALSWMLQKTLNVGGVVALGAAANVFLGMVEAPLMIRPYLKSMTRSELFITMTCGMATVAGTVMVIYAVILSPVMPDALGHILIASIISVPAAIVIALLMIPETGATTSGRVELPQTASGTMDAVAKGTSEGIVLLINIIAMLIVLVALVELANQLLGIFPAWEGRPLSLQRLLGFLMAPVVWLIGVPWTEAQTAGALLGTKTILNEFIAYVDLAGLPEGALSPRSRLMMVYALCGFANLGSLGILIGGMGAMAPERRGEIVALGFRSIVSGTMAACMTGAVIGLFL